MRQIDVTELTVLALLAEGPAHPYRIRRMLVERNKDYIVGSARTLYRSVERLERDGSIVAAETGREGRRPERTVYRLTPEGAERFRDQLGDLLSVPRTEVPVFTAALSLLAHLLPEHVAAALHAREALLEGQVAELETRTRALERRLHRILLVEADYLLALRRAELEWVRDLAAGIESGALRWDPDAARTDPASLMAPVTPVEGEAPSEETVVSPLRHARSRDGRS